MARPKQSNAQLAFVLTENGFLLDDRGIPAEDEIAQWEDRFREDPYSALYSLGFTDPPKETDLTGLFLHSVAKSFISALANNPDLEVARGDTRAEPDDETIRCLTGSVPFVLGAQYVSKAWIQDIFGSLNRAFSADVSSYDGSMAAYLASKNASLTVKNRVFFHLVERKNEDFPFAFLATYSTRDDDGNVRHVPLQYALTEYRSDREKLLSLLASLNSVCEKSPIIAQFVSSGEMFHPLQLTSEEAYRILRDVPEIENAGIICRIPDWWRKRSSRFSVTVKMGAKKNSFVGLETIVSAVPSITMDGTPLTKAEIRKLLAESDGLAFIKGKWVEVDHEKLKELLDEADRWGGDLTFLDTLRMGLGERDEAGQDGSPTIVHSEWLGQMLARLRDPGQIRPGRVPKSFHADLRPYQETGYAWLSTMWDLGLGACLADDMGLGKTVQILAMLEHLRTKKPGARVLLIVPASLIGNWEQEKNRFAPSMPLQVLHGKPAAKLAADFSESNAFLTITTYGIASRLEQLKDREWDGIILDEAQAIKNPKTKQSRSIRALHGRSRVALTGTPVENDLSNLWAIFDFLDHGLLGSMEEFKKYSASLGDRPAGYTGLRNTIAPFMLRRMKTDKNIIADLPDKTEILDYVNVSRKQAALYKQVVDSVARELAEESGDSFQRAGLVLRSLMKLKQICNHPDQYLGQPVTNWKDSGKFEMMREICSNIAQNRERVLVFTQFREMTKYLDEFLFEVFGTRGFVIHGGVTPKKRTEIVDAFQSDRYYPYVVLTVRAGGTGLNLTNANHVIHFDRWWNPAVENQATDRAFRIGQEKDVMVHKLITRGTIEESIDKMIESKRELAENVVGAGEKWITDLSNDELMDLMTLTK